MANTYHILMNVSKIIKQLSFLEISLVLIFITLPLGYFINSISLLIFFIYASCHNIKTKQGVRFTKLGVLLILLYSLCLLSLIWSNNFINTKAGLERFLPYFILPFSFALIHKKKISKSLILDLYSKSLVLYGIYCMVSAIIKAAKYSDKKYLFYHDLSGNLSQLNAIYMSVFTSLAIFFLLFKESKSKIDYSGFLFLIFFLILLSSKIIIVLTLIIVFIKFLPNFSKIPKFKKWLLYTPFLLVILALSASNLKNRIKVEFQKTNLAEVLKTKDFGHDYTWTGFGLRTFQTKVFFEIINDKKVIFTGLGLNNSQNALKGKYEEYNLYPGFYYYNFHNQYLQVFSELGLCGLLLLLFIFLLIFKKAIKTKDYFLLSFIILILVVSITESFLWRQRGMVFFITMSMLLMKNKKNYQIFD